MEFLLVRRLYFGITQTHSPKYTHLLTPTPNPHTDTKIMIMYDCVSISKYWELYVYNFDSWIIINSFLTSFTHLTNKGKSPFIIKFCENN